MKIAKNLNNNFTNNFIGFVKHSAVTIYEFRKWLKITVFKAGRLKILCFIPMSCVGRRKISRPNIYLFII